MNYTNNGGPAFPVPDASAWQGHGMTLRDYFAAKAMQGMSANPEMSGTSPKTIADIAYEWADAMLKAREQ